MIRVLLDEGVPVMVGEVFAARGHEVIPFDDVLARGSNDTLVCKAALANDAVLVAFDRDMKYIARGQPSEDQRFARLSLIRFECPEPMASKRLEFAMSLIEHEWAVGDAKAARRLFVEIGKHFIRSNR